MRYLSLGEVTTRLRSWFPDREFFMRSQGQVRFITLSSRLQMAAAALVAGFLVLWVLTMGGMALARWSEAGHRADLLTREAKVTSAENRVAVYRKGLDGVAGDLQRRQDFIEKMVQAHVGDLPHGAKAGETVSNSQAEAGKTVAKVSAAIPEASGLARLEARQLAFAEQLTRFADRRAAAVATTIRRLGIDPAMMLPGAERGDAQGGPLLALATGADGSLDPRFERLGASLARMDALEHGLMRMPQVLPAARDFISSGFGYRSDPFTHGGAFHPGLDFRGPIGAPIYAAAAGVISFAGQRSGYGNCIEVDHGNGLVTRYAHMSGFRARAGQQVGAGQLIGVIGSTGRSTGPHLHFEVRVHDHAVNPRPFLEARNHVPEEARASVAAGD